MKKMSFLLGLGVGFLLGSRAGTGPYEQVQATVQSVSGRPKVQESVDTVKDAVQDRVDQIADQVSEQVPGKVPATGSTSP